ncbi:ATP-binding protein [Curtobacterium sp. ISL-83]|uniref:ATP-binding protein n=1 Tax=Curtobacterium sp. ISL-83 TaxID=2819145 RepID=UPI001BE54041|nr:ATP-binding protein [Curtobacterium sp. ISL-83]MBT2503825.1 ATP-binding protein [Curtobacterium sp. ISL-83]
MTAVAPAHVLDLACPPDDVNAVHAFLASVWDREPSVSVEDRMALELALIELASNVIEHAGGDHGVTCSLRLDIGSDVIDVALLDDGSPAVVDPSTAHLPDADALAESGRGLALVQMVLEDLRYERLDTANRWTAHRGRH